MAVFRKLCRITRYSRGHKADSLLLIYTEAFWHFPRLDGRKRGPIPTLYDYVPALLLNTARTTRWKSCPTSTG